MTNRRLAAAGAFVGFLSGLVGSAGPLRAAAFLSMNLPPAAYISTEATTAVAMHASKIAVYRHFISFDRAAWELAAVLPVGMVIGSGLGKKTVERLSMERFRLGRRRSPCRARASDDHHRMSVTAKAEEAHLASRRSSISQRAPRPYLASARELDQDPPL